MKHQARNSHRARVPGPSPMPPVHMERLHSTQSGQSSSSDEWSKRISRVDWAAIDHVEDANAERQPSTVSEPPIRRVVRNNGPNYKNIGPIRAFFTFVKSQIGIGALGLPFGFAKLGLFWGIVGLTVVAIIAGFSAAQIGRIKRRHPEIRSFEDLGEYLFGKVGRTVFGAMYCLYYAFVGASDIKVLAVALNAITSHGICTVWFTLLASIGVGSLASMRTLGKISWLAPVGLVSILASLLTVIIAVGVQGHPSNAPLGSGYQLFVQPSALDVMSAMGNFCFSFSGTMAYFLVHDEMKDPEYYEPAMYASIVTMYATYVPTAVVLYYFLGNEVSSPALGSAGGPIKKIGYGVALLGLIVTGVLVCHFTARYLHCCIAKDDTDDPDVAGRCDHMNCVLIASQTSSRSSRYDHWRSRYQRAIWYSCVVAVMLFAFIIANVIPYFDHLITLIGASLGVFMLCLPMAYYWLYEHWSMRRNTFVFWFTACWCVGLLAFGCVFLVGGTYAAGQAIWVAQHNETAAKAFSCADTSITLPH